MPNPKHSSEATKAYFRQDGTVCGWWNPESRESLHYRHFREQLRWVLSQVDWTNHRVLDLGTGKGRLAVAAASVGAQVTGLDLSSEMLVEARRTVRDARLTVDLALGDAELLPFPCRAFDVVNCLEALMHFPCPDVALKEIRRVTRPGGIVVLSVTNRVCLTALVRWLGRLPGYLLGSRTRQPRIFWYHSLGDLRRLTASAGLMILRTHGQGLLQATARLPLGRGRFLPLVPRVLADWFFERIEPALRDTPLLALMGTILVVCRAGSDSDNVTTVRRGS